MIFFAHHLTSHECITAKYRLTSTIYTADARFVLSGSDDGNVRIWKARASDRLGVVTSREKAAMEYRDSLRERWKYDAEIDRVSRYVQTLIPHPFHPSPSSPSLQGAPHFPSLPFRPRCHKYFPLTLALSQEPPATKARTLSLEAQAHDARRAAGQRGAAQKTHSGGREQAQSREKEGRHHRAELEAHIHLHFSHLFIIFVTIIC